MDTDDTIAAISSPPGPGPRGLVRVTGPRAWDVALGGFQPLPDERPTRPTYLSGRLQVDGLDATLPASLALWPAPRTYTGQPLAELHMVGSPPLLGLVLAGILARGARAAEPGEFTLRAFLSGRIDLTRAEAVLGVIDARTRGQLDAALRQLGGGLATPIERLRDRLLDVLAHLEAGLDFVDEADVDPLGRAALAGELEATAGEVATLAGQLRGRELAEARPWVVLVGPPNAGKSRLFNALLGDDLALVSPVAGTTRDYLSASCVCDGLSVELIDTAGAESHVDAISSQAQEFRARAADRADLLLDCRPTGAPVVPDSFASVPRLVVATKCDLGPPDPEALPTSAATGAGLEALRLGIAAALRADDTDRGALAGSGARCRECLLHADRALRTAAETLMLGGGDELVAIDLRLAVDELGKVVGAVVTDDILDRIFRRFCIGK